MDPSDIDEWYENKKQKLFDDYRESHIKKKDPARVKERYRKKTAKLYAKYHRLWEKALEKEKRRKEWQHRISQLRKAFSEKLLKYREYFEFRFFMKKKEE